MKKLYTILAAAAVVMSASAAPALSLQQALSKSTKPVAELRSEMPAKAQMTPSAKKHNKAPRAAAEAATLEDIEGLYSAWGYTAGSDNKLTYGEFTAMEITIDPSVENTVIVSGFVGLDEIAYEAKWNPEAQTLTFDRNQTATFPAKGGPVEISFYAIVYDEAKNVSYTDVVLSYVDGMFYYEPPIINNTFYGLAYLGLPEGKGAAEIYYSLEMYPFNAMMQFTDYDENGKALETPSLAYVNITTNGSQLMVDNFVNIGFGATATMDIDSANKTFVSNKSLLFETSTEAFYLWAMDAMGAESAECVFTASSATLEDGSELPVAVHEGDIAVANADLSKGFVVTNPLFTLPFDPFDNSSVDNVAADNAPVVYYNLQGMRVENPANGLFIRRQGNTATKVVK